eukprot:PhF_6_TR38945/c0_g1_i1/m.58269
MKVNRGCMRQIVNQGVIDVRLTAIAATSAFVDLKIVLHIHCENEDSGYASEALYVYNPHDKICTVHCHYTNEQTDAYFFQDYESPEFDCDVRVVEGRYDCEALSIHGHLGIRSSLHRTQVYKPSYQWGSHFNNYLSEDDCKLIVDTVLHNAGEGEAGVSTMLFRIASKALPLWMSNGM